MHARVVLHTYRGGKVSSLEKCHGYPYRGCVWIPVFGVLVPERDELQHRVQELDSQVTEQLQKNRDLQVENEEISVLRDSVEEMKYLENKVVSHMTVT